MRGPALTAWLYSGEPGASAVVTTSRMRGRMPAGTIAVQTCAVGALGCGRCAFQGVGSEQGMGWVQVALLSDTHMPRGSRRLPDACVRLLARSDLIVHAGDFTAAGVLAELQELGPVEAVHGNMDDAELRAALPAQRVVEAGDVRIGVLHDAGRRDGREARLVAAFPGCAAVVYGHSHIPQVSR